MPKEFKNYAPGQPGISPRWTSSAKSGVGTSLNPASRVWFTISHGILNEVYYPRVDSACTRDLGLIVTDGKDYFSEEKRTMKSELTYLAEGVPAYRLVNTCNSKRYQITKEIIADPRRDVLLQRIQFSPLKGKNDDYHLYALLASHLANYGAGNTAWIDEYKGTPVLYAERDGHALAMVCSYPWLASSVGFVGVSDGWQDIHQHRQMTWKYDRAENGNVALTGEVDLRSGNGSFIIALGFGTIAAEAGQRAVSSLQSGFDGALEQYIDEWKRWHHTLISIPSIKNHSHDMYRTSAMVLRTHEASNFPGGIIASLSVPWGFAKGDDDLGGYHLIWPRDLVETAGGLLAAGARDEVHRVLHYLQATQEADGHWAQNMWLDGTPYWGGVQMDETAFPILLVDLARRLDVFHENELNRFWPMIYKAASYILCNGPVTQQDRWEEDPGYSPFTLAAEIAALLAAADIADINNQAGKANYLRETADAWNDNIESWIYTTGTEYCSKVGVEGYYVRIAPPDEADSASPASGFVPIKNRPPGQSSQPAAHIVSPDALALVRFGLRAPHDPRILNTIKVIDALLKVTTPFGPAWHRYNNDGYGEHADGSPFDGTGVGRVWPLLTGERAHYELAAGNKSEAKRLLKTLEAFSNEGGMIPEQIWDSPDIPERELFFGKPSGSAMPLVWAHAEYLKLKRSIRDGRVFDTPPQTIQRYQDKKTSSRFVIWRYNHKCRTIPAKKDLRVEVWTPAKIRWSVDSWKTIREIEMRDTGLGSFLADIPANTLAPGSVVEFDFSWTTSCGRPEEKHKVVVEANY